jgi:hypothetical protein
MEEERDVRVAEGERVSDHRGKRNNELLVSGGGRIQTTKGRGAVMVMVKGRDCQ